jgi:hypothetical protein
MSFHDTLGEQATLGMEVHVLSCPLLQGLSLDLIAPVIAVISGSP